MSKKQKLLTPEILNQASMVDGLADFELSGPLIAKLEKTSKPKQQMAIVDDFLDALNEDPLDKWYQIGNVITVVNAKLESELSDMSEYLLASEAAHAGAVVLSRAEEATKEEIKATVTHLNRALEKVRCDRRLDQEIIRKGSLALTDEDFAKLQQCGYVQENYQKMDFTEENSFDTVYVMERQMPVEKILAGMKKIFADPSCGAVFRIKGFMQEENGSWIEGNATRHELKKQPIKEGQEILIVIGEGLQEAAIRKYLSLRMNECNYTAGSVTVKVLNSY